VSELAKNVDRRLRESLDAQSEYYEQAVKLAEELEVRLRTGASTDELLCELQSILHRVSEIEDNDSQIRSQWRATSAQPSQRLQRATERTRQTLEQLLEIVRVAESAAGAAKDRLTPEMNVRARSFQMRQAYNSVTDSHQS
jgi:hypothetical protein